MRTEKALQEGRNGVSAASASASTSTSSRRGGARPRPRRRPVVFICRRDEGVPTALANASSVSRFSLRKQRQGFSQCVCQRKPSHGRGRPNATVQAVVSDLTRAGEGKEEEEEGRISSSTLQACEWPQVLKQLARFASTPMAREALLQGDYPSNMVARSASEANKMLQQTLTLRNLLVGEKKEKKREVEACLSCLREMSDVSVWLNMLAREGHVLDVRETDACITCIEDACQSIHKFGELLVAEAEEEKEEAITRNGFDLVFTDESKSTLATSKELVKACRKCVRPGLLYLDSNASPKLKDIRQGLKATDTELRETLDSICVTLMEEGLMEEKQVVFRRDRYCIAIKRGGQSMSASLKGALTLSESKTGQTVYVEPKICVAMNNNLVRLRSEEAKEEKRVLRKLSSTIRSNTSLVLQLYQKVTELDLIFCRAKHAVWTSGKKPQIMEQVGMGMTQVEEGEGEGGGGGGVWNSIELKQVVHPVLLEEALDKHGREEELQGVVPVDIVIPGRCKVLTISGPNTGGKTATMKTIALCVHMAKCGLFLHTRSNKKSDHERRKDQLPETNDCPRMLFFNAVLGDIGDNQSIESNLSTFSSHVTRLKDIAEIIRQRGACYKYLVLLDEVGSGTNPREGSSIAVSILKHFKENATLTVATTHFSELKQLASREKASRQGEWLNASVAFDTETLKPTYQLVWGESGSSNAMHIANAIGLDSGILEEARKELKAMTSFESHNNQQKERNDVGLVDGDHNKEEEEEEEEEGNNNNISTVLDSLVKQRSAVEELAIRSERLTSSIESSIKAMRALNGDSDGAGAGIGDGDGDGDGDGFSESWIRLMRSKLVEEEEEFYSSCVNCINAAVSHYKSGAWDQMRTDAFLRTVERGVKQRTTELAVLAQVSEDELQTSSSSSSSASSEADRVLWRPKRGERVRMKKLGGTRAVVIRVNAQSNTATLKKGQVQLTSSIEDLEPIR